MKRFIHYLVITSLLVFGGFFESCNEAQAGEQDWPQWRGPFVVLAISRREGTVLWQKSVYKKLPYEGGHNTASLASNSAVTDGTCPVPLALHTPYMNLRRVTVKLASRRIPRSGG